MLYDDVQKQFYWIFMTCISGRCADERRCLCNSPRFRPEVYISSSLSYRRDPFDAPMTVKQGSLDASTNNLPKAEHLVRCRLTYLLLAPTRSEDKATTPHSPSDSVTQTFTETDADVYVTLLALIREHCSVQGLEPIEGFVF